MGRTESHDFIHWTKAVEVFRGDPTRQIYAMPVFRYAGVYIGLPVVFQPETDRSHTELAWSSDTVHWHDVRIVARGRHSQFFINDKLASEFTDQSEDGRLDHGAIGLQIHDKGMQVAFTDIRLRQLVASHDRREAPRESRAVAPPPRSKYLLLDSRVVESVQNAKLAVGTVQKHKSNPYSKKTNHGSLGTTMSMRMSSMTSASLAPI